MSVELPELSRSDFAARVAGLAPEPLPSAAVEALYAHYQELRRWSRGLSLIGPGTAGEVLERHYGESLTALPLLPSAGGRLVDVGSGAGFPGVVLAAARPRWEVTLIEPRERKWAFLQSACRRAGLSCRCLNARVASLLPPGVPAAFEAVTVRALRLPATTLEALAARLAPEGRLLLWAGEAPPELPPGLRVSRVDPLPGSRVRRLLVLEHDR